MKRAARVGWLVLIVLAVVWTARRGDDAAPPPAHGRDRRAVLAPRPPSLHSAAPEEPNAADAPRLDGRVIGADGRGIDGATVTLDVVIPGFSGAPGPARTATTHADGQFVFDDLEGREYAVGAVAGDRIAGPIRFVATAAPRSLVLRLAQGAFATVAVVDEAQQPIAGATVRVQVGQHTSTAQTDADGKQKLGPLPPSSTVIEVEAAGYAPASRTATIDPSVALTIPVILYRGTPVSGRVIDEGHEPVVGARIAMASVYYSYYGLVFREAPMVTDDRGVFVIRSLARGRYSLRITDDQHAPGIAGFIVEGKPIDGIEVVMKEGGMITGVVRDDRHRPAPFARVALVSEWIEPAIADDSGIFELHGVPRMDVWLRAETPVANKLVRVNMLEKPQAEVDIVLDPAGARGAIAGTVVDEHGTSLAGISVTVSPDWKQMPRGGFRYPAGAPDTITDGDGKFAFDALPDLPYLVSARWRPHRWLSPPNQTAVRIGDGHVQIKLLPDGQVTGRVVSDHVDAPVKNVVISAGQRSTTANPDGSFLLTEIPEGTLDLGFFSPDFLREFKQVEIRPARTTDIGAITLTRSRTLVGRVVDASGAPVGSASVEIGVIRREPVEPDDPPAGFHGYGSSFSAPDGTFHISWIPPAPMFAVASDPAYGTSDPVAVPGAASVPGDPLPVMLVLPGDPPMR